MITRFDPFQEVPGLRDATRERVVAQSASQTTKDEARDDSPLAR